MIAPIISAETANKLNKKVMETIDPRLYLFCNYEPTIHYAISEDALFLISIQDLYKFAIDSGCVLKNYYTYLKEGQIPESQFNGLKKIIDTISMLRTVFDHNLSDFNGQIERNYIDQYSSWVKSALGKSTPEDINDYIVLNQQLTSLATQLVIFVEKFINCVALSPKKNSIIQKWKNSILHWYCSNSKTDIYLGQLQDAYIANTIANRGDYASLYEAPNIRRKIYKWIEEALYHPVNIELNQVTRDISIYQRVLSGELPSFEAMMKGKTTEQIEKEKQKIKTILKEKQARSIELKKNKDELDRLYDPQSRKKRYLEYFLKHLEPQLFKTAVRLDTEGIAYTYLPQDLIQEDIHYLFNGVRSPENDF